MNRRNDAYGAEMWAHYQGEPSFELIERDDGYVDLSGGVAVYFAPYKDWASYEKKAIALAGKNTLDIGCGPGRVCLYLQSKKMAVTGIDISPLAIKTARARGVKNARVLAVKDIGRFKTAQFDTIVMYCNNFGLFGNPSRCRTLLKTMARITTPGARILASSLDPATSNPDHRAYQRANVQKGRWRGQLRIRVRWLGYVGDWFDYFIVSPAEMRKLLRGTGWAVHRIYKSRGPMYIAEIIKK